MDQQTPKPDIMKYITIIIVSFVIATVVLAYLTINAAPSLLDKIFEKTDHLSKTFRTGTVNHSFQDYVSSISSSGGNELMVAKLESLETVSKSDELKVFWEKLNLGTTRSDISVPAIYRFYIDINGSWSMITDNNVCVVVAPPIRPIIPVAIDTELLQKRSEQGFLRWNEEEQMAELEKSITPSLNQKANAKIELIKDKARYSIARFVEKWVMLENRKAKNKITAIKVIFPDEVGKPGNIYSSLLLDSKDNFFNEANE